MRTDFPVVNVRSGFGRSMFLTSIPNSFGQHVRLSGVIDTYGIKLMRLDVNKSGVRHTTIHNEHLLAIALKT